MYYCMIYRLIHQLWLNQQIKGEQLSFRIMLIMCGNVKDNFQIWTFTKNSQGILLRCSKQKIHSALDFMFQTGEIIKRQLDFLKIKNPVISTFYTLPKIHKRLELPPDHPIVAGIGSLTSSISTFCGFLFKPYCEKNALLSKGYHSYVVFHWLN